MPEKGWLDELLGWWENDEIEEPEARSYYAYGK